MGETPTGKRTRRSGPRNKNGCLTCKIRHVKCDERRPACFNCTSTGRRCDEYQAAVIPSRPAVLPAPEQKRACFDKANPWADFQVTLAPTLGVPSNEQTRRLYHSFLYEVVPSLCESLDSAFWRTDILRNSASRPAVQHAAIALGAMYEQHRARQNDRERSASNPHDAELQLLSSIWYTAAIQSLRDRVNQSSSNDELVEEAMMACLLFVCIEILRGDDIAAVTHLEGAIAVFRNWSSAQPTTSISQRSQCSGAMTSALQVVSKIFMRLDVQAASYMGSRSPWFCIQNLSESRSLEDIPNSFVNVLQARDSLYFHLNSILAFTTPPHGAEQCFPGWTPHPDRGFDTYTIFHGSVYRDFSLPQASSQRRRFMKTLSSWKSAFQGLLQQCTEKRPEDLVECALLWLVFYTIRVKLATSYTENECLYDEQLPQFKKMTEHVEAYQRYAVGKSLPLHASDEEYDLAEKTRKIRPKKRDLTIHMGVNYPLYYTVLKCRNKPLRQRALTLLQATGIESVWDGQMLARVAEFVIDVEETAPLSNSIPEDGKNFGVPEANRVHCLSLNIDRGSRRIWLQYSRRRLAQNGKPLETIDVGNRWRIDNTVLSW